MFFCVVFFCLVGFFIFFNLGKSGKCEMLLVRNKNSESSYVDIVKML